MAGNKQLSKEEKLDEKLRDCLILQDNLGKAIISALELTGNEPEIKAVCEMLAVNRQHILLTEKLIDGLNARKQLLNRK